MLAIILVNDGTGKDGTANYKYQVKVTAGEDDGTSTLRVISSGRVEGHKRMDGWEHLVRMMLKDHKERQFMDMLSATSPSLPPPEGVAF